MTSNVLTDVVHAVQSYDNALTDNLLASLWFQSVAMTIMNILMSPHTDIFSPKSCYFNRLFAVFCDLNTM